MISTFPALPGLKPTTSRTPTWKTIIKEAVSGRELRIGRMAYPRWSYSLSFEFLRDRAAARELQSLIAHYNLAGGQRSEFPFVDSEGIPVIDPDTGLVIGSAWSACARQAFGTGDGGTLSFQLARAVSDGSLTYVEPVWLPTGAPKLYDNGTLVSSSNYSISATGQIQFSAAPASGHALTWTGTYSIRCRYTADTQEFKRMILGFYEAPKVEFISIIP